MERKRIIATTRQFILEEVVPGASNAVTERTALVSGGILDSIGMLRLVSFLEAEFGVELEPEHLAPEHWETLSSIADMVTARLSNV
jgi:acyl carrier protein